MHDTSRSDALVALTKYQADRPKNFAEWLAWAGGIVRSAAALMPGDEGLDVTSVTLISVLKKSTKEIFRLVMTADVQESAANNQVVLAGGTSPSKVVTGILAARDELTVEYLADCGLAELNEAARDRLCEKLNAVWFRPWVDLSPELKVSLLTDMVKALKELGDKVPFKEALKAAARTGDYSAVAALMDGESLDLLEDDGESDADPVEPPADEGEVPGPAVDEVPEPAEEEVPVEVPASAAADAEPAPSEPPSDEPASERTDAVPDRRPLAHPAGGTTGLGLVLGSRPDEDPDPGPLAA